jgi:hypothetical protein
MVTISSAESNRAVLRYIAESVWGTTPASGTTKEMRITSSSISVSKDTKQSEELRSDRMISSIIETSASTSGDVNFELSAGSQDDFFQHFLLGAWSEAMTFFKMKGTSVSITANNKVVIAGGDYRNYINTDYVKTEGFLTPGNNGYWLVTGKAYTGGNTELTISGTPLVVEAGSAYTKVLDASDVILKSTTTAIEASNTINGGGANAFAGKTLAIGQKIYVEGLGKETGTIQCNATDPTDGDTFVITDGVQTVTFEIRADEADVASGNVWVDFSGTPATLMATIVTAINDQFRKENLRCTATDDTVDTVTVKNHRMDGGSITSASGGLTIVDFSGGSTSKGGFLTISSLPDDDTIVVAETITADANGGGLTVVIKGSHLRNPSAAADITKQSFSVETGFTDVSKFFEHTGLRTGGFNLDVKVGDIVTGKFTFKGRETTTESATVLGASPYTAIDATTTEVFNATSNVGSIYKDGTALSTAILAISIEGDANLREQRAVGERFPAGIGYGRFSLKGSVEAYFENFDLYNDFLEHTTTSIQFDLEDADHNTYYFTFPAVKFVSDPIFPDGIDKDVVEKLNWMAQRDPATQTMMMMDRFSSVYPASAA